MHILISNDDGFRATGIQELAEAMLPYGDVTIVAPAQVSQEQSPLPNLFDSSIVTQQALSRYIVVKVRLSIV